MSKNALIRLVPIKPLLGAAAVSLWLLAGVSPAQAQGPGPGAGPGPAASAPGPGPRPGMGPGGGGGSGRHMGGRWGSRYTPGWSLMTPEERTAHQQQMQAVKGYEECTTLRDQHREQMAARAKEKGLAKPPATPRRDACAALKPKPAPAKP